MLLVLFGGTLLLFSVRFIGELYYRSTRYGKHNDTLSPYFTLYENYTDPSSKACCECWGLGRVAGPGGTGTGVGRRRAGRAAGCWYRRYRGTARADRLASRVSLEAI